VIAWKQGSVPELIESGVSGWIVESVDEAVTALRRVDRIDRRACRSVFERRFTAERMARDYVAIYEALVHKPGAARLEALSA
jgi:glycosyltransferase involved in cell wall biosynthesis